VACDTGGVSEVMGTCGILIPQDDPAALADAVVGLLNDAELWDRLAFCGKARAKDEFGVVRMRDELHAVYEEAAQRA
jgi:glycosyltransferase involved in cell wall biosynthesis